VLRAQEQAQKQYQAMMASALKVGKPASPLASASVLSRCRVRAHATRESKRARHPVHYCGY
jgi:hypothetical protein